MRILGIDYGDRRIGLAIGDLEVAGATGLPTLERARASDDVIEPLRRLCQEHDVARIVVGLPLHLNGRSGQAAQAARDFARALAEATALPVETLDERWTSVEAERALREAPRGKRKRRKEVVDAMAATLILRTYLEIQRGRAARGGEA